MVDVVTDLVQRGVTADEVDQGNSATVATLAENADEPDKKILLVGELIDFAFEGAPTTLIGTPVEGTFDFALDAVGTGHGTCALGTSVWMLAMEATHWGGGMCKNYLELSSLAGRTGGAYIFPALLGIEGGVGTRRGGSQRARLSIGHGGRPWWRRMSRDEKDGKGEKGEGGSEGGEDERLTDEQASEP